MRLPQSTHMRSCGTSLLNTGMISVRKKMAHSSTPGSRAAKLPADCCNMRRRAAASSVRCGWLSLSSWPASSAQTHKGSGPFAFGGRFRPVSTTPPRLLYLKASAPNVLKDAPAPRHTLEGVDAMRAASLIFLLFLLIGLIGAAAGCTSSPAPAGDLLCRACTNDSQCGGNPCYADVSGQRYCGRPCDGGCPAGYSCAPLEGTGGQVVKTCFPDSLACASAPPPPGGGGGPDLGPAACPPPSGGGS